MSQIKQKLLSQVTDIATSDTSKKEESLQKRKNYQHWSNNIFINFFWDQERDLEEREELERARAELELAKLEEEELKKTGKVLTREEKIDERKKRELVEKYGGKMEVDEDGDFVYVGVEKDKDIGMALNENQERVKSQAASEREAAKKKHQEKVKHEKELLEKDKLKKEKAKRKTQKREKRRMWIKYYYIFIIIIGFL